MYACPLPAVVLTCNAFVPRAACIESTTAVASPLCEVVQIVVLRPFSKLSQSWTPAVAHLLGPARPKSELAPPPAPPAKVAPPVPPEIAPPRPPPGTGAAPEPGTPPLPDGATPPVPVDVPPVAGAPPVLISGAPPVPGVPPEACVAAPPVPAPPVPELASTGGVPGEEVHAPIRATVARNIRTEGG